MNNKVQLCIRVDCHCYFCQDWGIPLWLCVVPHRFGRRGGISTMTVTATWWTSLNYMCFFSASCFHPVTLGLTATEDFTDLTHLTLQRGCASIRQCACIGNYMVSAYFKPGDRTITWQSVSLGWLSWLFFIDEWTNPNVLIRQYF